MPTSPRPDHDADPTLKALLRAACEEPDADAPRLVYADALEERGAAARAGLIRAQCALAGPLARKERVRIRRLARKLLDELLPDSDRPGPDGWYTPDLAPGLWACRLPDGTVLAYHGRTGAEVAELHISRGLVAAASLQSPRLWGPGACPECDGTGTWPRLAACPGCGGDGRTTGYGALLVAACPLEHVTFRDRFCLARPNPFTDTGLVAAWGPTPSPAGLPRRDHAHQIPAGLYARLDGDGWERNRYATTQLAYAGLSRAALRLARAAAGLTPTWPRPPEPPRRPPGPVRA